MTRTKLAVASVILVLAMVGVGLWVAAHVPAQARLPVHWGINGRPNGYAGKWTALMMPPVMTALTSLLFYFLPSIEPREKHLQKSQGLVLVGWAALLMVNIVVEATIISGALNWAIPTVRLMLVAVGAMFVLIGNQLGKSRSMFLVGIRTPWTLSSEEVWMKTNRLGGKLMVAGGLVMVIAALVSLPGRVVPGLVIALVAIIVGVPLVYSYLLWRREQRPASGRG